MMLVIFVTLFTTHAKGVKERASSERSGSNWSGRFERRRHHLPRPRPPRHPSGDMNHSSNNRFTNENTIFLITVFLNLLTFLLTFELLLIFFYLLLLIFLHTFFLKPNLKERLSKTIGFVLF